MSKTIDFVAMVALLAACGAAPPEVPGEHGLAADMVTTARRFLSSLTPAQREAALFDAAAEDRLAWHFIPKARPGIALRDLDDAQRALAYAFLATALGRSGFAKATGVMALEEVLRRVEQGAGPFVRDPGAYHLSVFGTPLLDATWGWRLEGHYLSLNLTLIDGTRVVHAPAFFGAAPARVTEGTSAIYAVGREEDLGFRLIQEAWGTTSGRRRSTPNRLRTTFSGCPARRSTSCLVLRRRAWRRRSARPGSAPVEPGARHAAASS